MCCLTLLAVDHWFRVVYGSRVSQQSLQSQYTIGGTRTAMPTTVMRSLSMPTDGELSLLIRLVDKLSNAQKWCMTNRVKLGNTAPRCIFCLIAIILQHIAHE